MKLLAILLFAAATAPLTLDMVKAEPDLEKRSELALKFGKETLKQVRTAYDDGKLDQVKTLVADVESSVQLCVGSLEQSKKNPRRSKYFKRAEIRTREMLREVNSLSEHMSYSDRSMLEPLQKQLHDANDGLLRGIMGMK